MNTVRPRLCRKLADQLVECGGADRVEAGGRLVEEQDLGVERQRPRQAGALAHAAATARRDILSPASGGRPTRAIFRPAIDCISGSSAARRARASAR